MQDPPRRHAGRASALALLGDYGLLPAGDARRAARAAAERAIALDETLADAHAALAFVETGAWEWRKAEQHFRRALALDPGYGPAHHWYSVYLIARGCLDDARNAMEQALQLDPLSHAVRGTAAGFHYYAREPAAALEASRRLLELDEANVFAHVITGLTHELEGRYAEALTALKRAIAQPGAPQPFLHAALAHAHASSGKHVEARRALGTLSAQAQQGRAPPFCIAALHLAVDEGDAAVEWLGRSLREHDGWILSLMVHPWFDPLRGDPRYAALLKSAGLATSRTPDRARSV